MIQARRYVVEGRVQGVGFRFFTERAAREAQLSGFVRNRDDGAVEIEAEGDRDALTRFERALRQGPPGARVDAVTVEERAPSRRAGGFHARP